MQQLKDYQQLHNSIGNFQIFSVVPNGRNLYYTIVDEQGRRYDMEVRDFRPYFFIPVNSIKWHKPFLELSTSKKIILNHPAQVRQEREKYQYTYEADILYDIRFSYDINVEFNKKKAKSVPLHIWFADIEVFRNFKEGRPDYKNDTNIVNAISFYDTILDKYFSIVVIPPDNVNKIDAGKLITKNDKGQEVILIKVKTEEKLFQVFLHLLNKIKPVIFAGWNFINFDITYLVQRLKKKYPDLLPYISPHFNVNPTLRINDNGISNDIFIPGLTIVDLQMLYKKFEQEKKDSYKLDFIAKEELGEGKVEYTGSLDKLWIENFEKFLDYSYKDIELLVELEEKRQFILLINELKEISGLPLYYFNFDWTLKFNDGLVIKYIRTKLPKKYAVKSKSTNIDDYKIKGGFVKVPKVGFHYWVIDLDASSMYPSGMLSYNISPETFLGRIFNVDIKDIQQYVRPYMFNKIEFKDLPNRLVDIEYIKPSGETITIGLDKLKFAIYRITDRFSIAPNGSIFDLSNDYAVIPTIQADLRTQRKVYKNLMKIWKVFDNLLDTLK